MKVDPMAMVVVTVAWSHDQKPWRTLQLERSPSLGCFGVVWQSQGAVPFGTAEPARVLAANAARRCALYGSECLSALGVAKWIV